MYFLLAAFMFAVLESFALWKKIRGLEFIAKPAVMIVLFVYLWTSTGLHGRDAVVRAGDSVLAGGGCVPALA